MIYQGKYLRVVWDVYVSGLSGGVCIGVCAYMWVVCVYMYVGWVGMCMCGLCVCWFVWGGVCLCVCVCVWVGCGPGDLLYYMQGTHHPHQPPNAA